MNEELISIIENIETHYLDQYESINTRNSYLMDYEYNLKRALDKYNELTNPSEKNEFLNSTRFIDDINAYYEYVKQLDKEMKIYNDYINRFSTFSSNNISLDDSISQVINRSRELNELINNNCNKLVKEIHEFLISPQEKSIANITNIIRSINSEDIGHESRNISNRISEIVTDLKSNIESNQGDITIIPANYDSIKVFNESVKPPTNVVINKLGNNVNSTIRNRLSMPEISLEDLTNYAYRIHNQRDSQNISLDGKTTFSNDEYLYQEFLSYVSLKMREQEPLLSLKLEGLHPNKKRELLEEYKNEIISQITGNISINNGTVVLPQYLLESSAILFILRTNGYNVSNTNNIDDFLKNNTHVELTKDTKIDTKKMSEDLSKKFKKSSLDDSDIKKSLNYGKAINADDFENLNKLEERITNLQEILKDFTGTDNQEKLVSALDNLRLMDLATNRHNIESLYQRGISHTDQLDNYNLLIDNYNMIIKTEEMKRKFVRKPTESTRDEILKSCEEILKSTQEIKQIYTEENKSVIIKKNITNNDLFVDIGKEIKESEEKEIFNIEEEVKEVSKKKSTKAMGIYDKFDKENQQLYDSIMKKSYTSILNKLDNKELAYLHHSFKQVAESIMKKANSDNLSKSQLNDTDAQYIAIYVKLNNRYKQVIAKRQLEEKQNSEHTDKVLDELFKKTDSITDKKRRN